jgi:phosphoribosyl 1,2-cyclic phosphodiesterase
MQLYITSLNSGSNANCYYIGNDQEAVLIDAGLSCRETEKRMNRLGLDIKKIKAIFISHEHTDHIYGLATLSKKHQLPVYITNATLKNSKLSLEPHLITSFTTDKAVTIGELSVTPFSKSHDADDPHSFMVSSNEINIGVITDIGYACKRVINYFGKCHAVFLEANYCEDMLANGDYPYHLKKRISGDKGHLSNTQALDLFITKRSAELQLLILSHLSKNNNKPELVNELFNKQAGTVQIVVASRYEETSVFCINKANQPWVKKRNRTEKNQQLQLSLF